MGKEEVKWEVKMEVKGEVKMEENVEVKALCNPPVVAHSSLVISHSSLVIPYHPLHLTPQEVLQAHAACAYDE